jgi:competence protein ComGC
MSRIMLQQRKKIRFNFIDIMIVLLIISVIGTAVYLIMSDFRPKNKMIDGGNATICVRISDVDESALQLIKQAKNEGLEVKDAVTGEKIGTILGYNAENKTKYYGKTAVKNEDGVYVVPSSEYENKFDVKVYISVEAQMDERGIYEIAGNRILVGSPIHFKIPSFAAVSYIIEVTKNLG